MGLVASYFTVMIICTVKFYLHTVSLVSSHLSFCFFSGGGLMLPFVAGFSSSFSTLTSAFTSSADTADQRK